MAEIDSKLAEGIAFFEKMLQTMPGDRTSLEFLAVAYAQAGEKDKCRKALISLANCLLKEHDLDSADRIAERLAAYDEPDAKTMVLRVKAAHEPPPRPETPKTAPAAAVPLAAKPASEPLSESIASYIQTAAKAEIALVWKLRDNRIFDDAIANDLVHRLSDLPVDERRPYLVSALATLEDGHPDKVENAMAFLADAGSTPPIPLESFEAQPVLLHLLPEPFIRVHGAVPFAAIGKAVLVALLDPLDDALRREVETRTGRPCHFFLAHPHAVEAVFMRSFHEAGVTAKHTPGPASPQKKG